MHQVRVARIGRSAATFLGEILSRFGPVPEGSAPATRIGAVNLAVLLLWPPALDSWSSYGEAASADERGRLPSQAFRRSLADSCDRAGGSRGVPGALRESRQRRSRDIRLASQAGMAYLAKSRAAVRAPPGRGVSVQLDDLSPI